MMDDWVGGWANFINLLHRLVPYAVDIFDDFFRLQVAFGLLKAVVVLDVINHFDVVEHIEQLLQRLDDAASALLFVYHEVFVAERYRVDYTETQTLDADHHVLSLRCISLIFYIFSENSKLEENKEQAALPEAKENNSLDAQKLD